MEIEGKQMNDHIEVMLKYIDGATGLTLLDSDDQELKVLQKADSKVLTLKSTDVEKVLSRVDTDGKPFIQVNLNTGKKLLMTEALIGFRPVERLGLDMSKVPNVVTTPDLIGVIEALEDSLHDEANDEDLDILKKLFHSVLDGAENVGFDLSNERTWLQHLNRSGVKASA